MNSWVWAEIEPIKIPQRAQVPQVMVVKRADRTWIGQVGWEEALKENRGEGNQSGVGLEKEKTEVKRLILDKFPLSTEWINYDNRNIRLE